MRYKLLKAATTTIFRLNQKAQLNFVRHNYNGGVILSQLRGGDSDSTSSNILGHSKHKNNIHPKHHSMSTNITMTDDDTWTIREEDNGEAFSSLSHVGYSLHPDPAHKTGGWLAHRVALQQAQHSTDSTNTVSENIDLPPCWIRDEVASKITKFNYSEMPIGRAPRILVLYGSLRPTSFSKKLAYEFARLLETLGCDVRTYNPSGLPVRDPSLENEVKVKELRSLTLWSDGHVWVSPGKSIKHAFLEYILYLYIFSVSI